MTGRTNFYALGAVPLAVVVALVVIAFVQASLDPAGQWPYFIAGAFALFVGVVMLLQMRRYTREDREAEARWRERGFGD